MHCLSRWRWTVASAEVESQGSALLARRRSSPVKMLADAASISCRLYASGRSASPALWGAAESAWWILARADPLALWSAHGNGVAARHRVPEALCDFTSAGVLGVMRWREGRTAVSEVAEISTWRTSSHRRLLDHGSGT